MKFHSPRIIIIGILSLVVNQFLAQCTLHDIIPFEHGITKYNALKKSWSIPTIEENTKRNLIEGRTKWYKPDYLHGDSIETISRDYFINNHLCFGGAENSLLLVFADDKLYRINIDMEFNKTDFYKCDSTYRAIVKLLQRTYSVYEETTVVLVENDEQIGESFIFYPPVKETIDKDKTKYVSISLEVKYRFEKQNGGYVKTSNIDKYVISIWSIDIYGTRLHKDGEL